MRGEDDCIGRRDSSSSQHSNARPCVYACVYIRTCAHRGQREGNRMHTCACIAWRNSLPLTAQHTPDTTPVPSQPLCGPLRIVRKAHHQHTYHTTLHDTRTPHPPYTKYKYPDHTPTLTCAMREGSECPKPIDTRKRLVSLLAIGWLRTSSVGTPHELRLWAWMPLFLIASSCSSSATSTGKWKLGGSVLARSRLGSSASP